MRPVFFLAAGVYRRTATYNGDANNNSVAHPCNSANESATIVESTPTLATVASAGGNIGTQLTDTATVSGGSYPSSPSFMPLCAGVYRWIATYSGEPNNAAVAGACNAANENVTIAPPPPDGPPRPVPTLSAWAMTLLAMMLGATAMAGARRRRR